MLTHHFCGVEFWPYFDTLWIFIWFETYLTFLMHFQNTRFFSNEEYLTAINCLFYRMGWMTHYFWEPLYVVVSLLHAAGSRFTLSPPSIMVCAYLLLYQRCKVQPNYTLPKWNHACCVCFRVCIRFTVSRQLPAWRFNLFSTNTNHK